MAKIGRRAAINSRHFPGIASILLAKRAAGMAAIPGKTPPFALRGRGGNAPSRPANYKDGCKKG